ncbi:MAG: phospho-sugar mutase [Anaerovoracaceae bacterium]|jgi:phosphoglucomutase
MSYRDEYEKWLQADAVDEATRRELRDIAGDEEQIEDRFSGMLQFGTAGLRGRMRAGLNGMNVYTVRYATQGMANLIKSCGEDPGSGVTIAYDSRSNSRLFAEQAAAVLAANEIHVHLFDDLRPTPELSFAIRETGSIAGINITASHNPKEYNGYKAYWSDGAQLPPEHAAQVSASMERIDIFDDVLTCEFADAVESGRVAWLGEEMDERYMEQVLAQSVGGRYVRQAADDFEIVYTPFHGAGCRLVPEVLHRLGIRRLIPVAEQMKPDGDFPTVASPNPENAEGFAMAIALAASRGVDLIIGTDPDSDRCGAVVRSGEEYQVLSGNQIGVLLLDYLITLRRENGTLPADAAAVKSIVSTPMFNKICAVNGVTAVETLTGFKFIGEKIKEFEETGAHTFLFGFEESLGFLAGTYARDKDAVVAAMLIAEMGCWYKTRGMTLYDGLQELYRRYGYYREVTKSIVFEGLDAQQRMQQLMAQLRRRHPAAIGLPVRRVRDYQQGTVTDLADGATVPTGLGRSDVLFYELEDDCAAVVRPSGTEPKIKLYVMARGDDAGAADQRFTAILEAGTALLQKA